MRNDFDLVLPRFRDTPVAFPFTNAGGLYAESSGGGRDAAEVLNDLFWSHTPDRIGAPMDLSIGTPMPPVGRLIGMPKTLADRAKWVREQRGLNQTAYAKRLGITQPSLSDIENGETKSLRGGTLVAYQRDGVNPEYLMKGKGVPFLDAIEQKLRDDSLHAMIADLDEDQKGVVEDLVRGMLRRRKGPNTHDPYPEEG